ncbi:hypothetical protein H4P1_00082 (plasmid) [Variovorax sp. PBS-H4]|nr:hypothetical protein H4P1_00082 [Variovorax sp. PBS-H4]
MLRKVQGYRWVMNGTAILWFMGGGFVLWSLVYALFGRKLYRASERLAPDKWKEPEAEASSVKAGVWVCGAVGVLFLAAAVIVTMVNR